MLSYYDTKTMIPKLNDSFEEFNVHFHSFVITHGIVFNFPTSIYKFSREGCILNFKF